MRVTNIFEGGYEAQYFYNNRDELIGLIYKDKNINTVTFSYKYDKMGNWIEQLKSVNNKPMYNRRREIYYY